MSKSYKALTGLRYPDGPAEVQKAARAKSSVELNDVKWKSIEAGTVADDLPEQSIPWLLEQGRIEAAPEQAAKGVKKP